MARRNTKNRNRYNADTYDETAAFLAKAARRAAYNRGQTGYETKGGTDGYGPRKGDRKDRRSANRHALMSGRYEA